MRTQHVAVALIVIVLFGACMSSPAATGAGDAYDEIIRLVNEAPVEDLVGQSHVPMIFDAELIVRTGDVELLWSGLRDTGFSVSRQDYLLQPARPGDHVRVADDFDMKSFFSPDHGFPAEARWIEAESSAGPVLLLLGEFQNGLPLIYGISRVRS
jgi:hypothetical protein